MPQYKACSADPPLPPLININRIRCYTCYHTSPYVSTVAYAIRHDSSHSRVALVLSFLHWLAGWTAAVAYSWKRNRKAPHQPDALILSRRVLPITALYQHAHCIDKAYRLVICIVCTASPNDKFAVHLHVSGYGLGLELIKGHLPCEP